jgi:hypothetical protein
VSPTDPTSDGTPPRIGPLKLALFALIPVTILVVLAEVASAFTIERRARIDELPDGGREYRMQVGSWPWSRRVATPINSDGFPDREFPDSVATKTCLHVVFIGDSFILGDGVDGDSAFAQIVGRELAARPGTPCIRSFSLGERGSTIPRQARRLRALLPRLRPDVVVLGQYQNDLTDLLEDEPRDLSRAAEAAAKTARAAGDSAGSTNAATANSAPMMPVERFSFLNPRLVRLLAYHTFGALITSGIHRDELEHWSVIADTARRDEAARLMAIYAASFDSLASDLARDSIAFGTIILPSKFDIMAGRFPEEEFFLGLAARHRVPALRIFPVLDVQRRPYAFLMYDGHLNERGNRVVATAVTDWLLRSAPAPFPALHALPGPTP